MKLDLTYEDVGDPDPNPTGVGRSYEITLQAVPSTPSRQTLAQLASINVGPFSTPYVTPQFDMVYFSQRFLLSLQLQNSISHTNSGVDDGQCSVSHRRVYATNL